MKLIANSGCRFSCGWLPPATVDMLAAMAAVPDAA